jgi:hypothetical protein
MKFTGEQLVDSFTKRYIEDIGHKTYNELFAIFDIIIKEFKVTGGCPICKENEHSIEGHYNYNNAHVACEYGYFAVNNDIITFAIQANHCPICGKYIGKK